MRAGSGTAGIVTLALSVCVTAANAQSVARSSAHSTGGDAAVAPRAVAAPASRLPGALATASPLAQVELEYLPAQALRDREDDEDGAFWPSFFGLPSSEGSAHRAGGLAIARRAGWPSFLLPGLDLLQRALPGSAAARLPGAARLRLGLQGADDASELEQAIGADAHGNAGQSGDAHGRGLEMRALHANANASFNRDADSGLPPGANVPGRTESAADFDYSLGSGSVDGTSSTSLPTSLMAVNVAAAAAVTVTPEPASLVLLGTGVVAWGAIARRRRML